MEGSSGDLRLDAPLPWDHIDTGIDKGWLITDLARAIAAATVPDCSFEGCSHCGVCGTDFGHNVVIEPLPIPESAGNFVPNTTKLQRLRVWFGKLGDMALVGHLDLLRLFDRAVRRAGLPVSFKGGFHPSPRIAIATALPLGVTSCGEIVEFELSELVEPGRFQEQLAQQLPVDIPVYSVATVDLKAPAAAQLLSRAEYLITVAVHSDASLREWHDWVEAILARDAIRLTQTTKSGRSQVVNLRDRLFELEVVETQIEPPRRGQPRGRVSRLERTARRQERTEEGDVAVLRYVGSCRNDGCQLRPEQVVAMLEQVGLREFQLLHIHRSGLLLLP